MTSETITGRKTERKSEGSSDHGLYQKASHSMRLALGTSAQIIIIVDIIDTILLRRQ